jgi:pyruvate ferredoxin oxidoreductase alpha subunit
MSQRDCGWLQLYAESNQEALDLHLQAFKLAEQLSLPVMVCMDGFVLTHAFEEIEVPDADAVAAFLPRVAPQHVLDPDDPMTIGAMVGPEAFTEVRWLMHRNQLAALEAIPRVSGRFAAAFGRASGGLVRGHRLDGAQTVVVTLGSVMGTVEDLVDDLRRDGQAVGALAIGCFRPSPMAELRAALAGADRVVVVERAFAPGVGGIVGQDVRLALAGRDRPVHDVIAGLGGRPITRRSLRAVVERAIRGELVEEPTFLDLREEALVGVGRRP